jgi:hypothetical protein
MLLLFSNCKGRNFVSEREGFKPDQLIQYPAAKFILKLKLQETGLMLLKATMAQKLIKPISDTYRKSNVLHKDQANQYPDLCCKKR